MTKEEQVDLLNELLGIEEKNDIGNLTSTDRREFQQWVEELEQELCDDEYIKVPKKALKYRTAGMVAYNVEWLKNHFDIERTVICGAQESCGDLISRQAVLEKQYRIDDSATLSTRDVVNVEDIEEMPSVTPTDEFINRKKLDEAIERIEIAICEEEENTLIALGMANALTILNQKLGIGDKE